MTLGTSASFPDHSLKPAGAAARYAATRDAAVADVGVDVAVQLAAAGLLDGAPVAGDTVGRGR